MGAFNSAFGGGNTTKQKISDVQALRRVKAGTAGTGDSFAAARALGRLPNASAAAFTVNSPAIRVEQEKARKRAGKKGR